MTLLMKILLPLYALLIITQTINAIRDPHSKITFINKMLTCSVFMLLGLIQFHRIIQLPESDYRFDLFIMLGLTSCYIGDVLLGLRNVYKEKLNVIGYILGTVFFMVAHIFYILAFTSFMGVELSILHFIVPILIVLVVLFTLIALKVTNKAMFATSLVYALIIGEMFTCGIIYFTTKTIAINRGDILASGVLFLISDFTLLLKYFYHGKLKEYIILITTPTYFAAQLFMILALW